MENIKSQVLQNYLAKKFQTDEERQAFLEKMVCSICKEACWSFNSRDGLNVYCGLQCMVVFSEKENEKNYIYDCDRAYDEEEE